MNAAAVVAAGGSSSRMGFDKTAGMLCGVPLLTRTLQRLAEVEELREIIAAVPPGSEERLRSWCVTPFGLEARVHLVAGGPARVHSVWNAMRSLRCEPDVIAIHDGARPFVSVTVIRDALRTAQAHGGALVALPMIPTVKQVRDRRVMATVDRTQLWCAATPQAFRYREFVRAYEDMWASGVDVTTVTDDAQIFERAGGTVMIVESNLENIKLTTPFDWRIAELLAAEK